jgi:transcriptional regulator with XRE-family HTH domain
MTSQQVYDILARDQIEGALMRAPKPRAPGKERARQAAIDSRVEGPDPVDIEVGARVRMRRREMGLSQTDLAVKCGKGITFQQIQKYERGANRISASRLVQIAGVLECRAADLLPDTTTDAVTTPLAAIVNRLAVMPGAVSMLTKLAAAPIHVRRGINDLLAALAREEA